MPAHIVFTKIKSGDMIDARSITSELLTSGQTSAVANVNYNICIVTATAANAIYVAFSQTGTPNTANVSGRFYLANNATKTFVIGANTKIGVLDI